MGAKRFSYLHGIEGITGGAGGGGGWSSAGARKVRGPVIVIELNYCNSKSTLIMVYKGCMILKTRGIPYYFQNFDSFYPLIFFQKVEKSLNFLHILPKLG